MRMETFELELRDEFARLLRLEESVVVLMQFMQEDAGVESLDPRVRKEICNSLAHLAAFHRHLREALASSSEMIELLESPPPRRRAPRNFRRDLPPEDDEDFLET